MRKFLYIDIDTGGDFSFEPILDRIPIHFQTEVELLGNERPIGAYERWLKNVQIWGDKDEKVKNWLYWILDPTNGFSPYHKGNRDPLHGIHYTVTLGAWELNLTVQERGDIARMAVMREDKKASQTQVDGDHYLKLGIQPLEATYLNFGYAGLKASVYCKVNKYMTREKDDEIVQLKKARHTLDYLIEKAELEAAKRV